MTRIPDLEDHLREAAARRAPRRARRARGLGALSILIAALAAAGVVGLGISSGGDPEIEATSPGSVNRSPSMLERYGDKPPESGYAYSRKPTLLATGYRDGEAAFHVVGYELKPPEGAATLCLDVAFQNSASGCFSPTERAQGTAGGTTTQTAVGATTQQVDRVQVLYRDDDRAGRADAVLARAEDAAALKKLGIAEPFTFYVATIPPRASPVEATAFLAGREVWRAQFP